MGDGEEVMGCVADFLTLISGWFFRTNSLQTFSGFCSRPPLLPEVGLGQSDNLAVNDQEGAPVGDRAILKEVIPNDAELGLTGALDCRVGFFTGHDKRGKVGLTVFQADGDIGRRAMVPPPEIEVIAAQGAPVEIGRCRPHVVGAFKRDGLAHLACIDEGGGIVEELIFLAEGKVWIDGERQHMCLLELHLRRFGSGASGDQ